MADLSGLRDHLQQWATLVTVDALQRTLQETQQAAPVRTGALRNSIQVSTPQSDGAVIRAEITADTPYAGFTDTGTQSHIIRGNPLLVFMWPNDPRPNRGKGPAVFRWVNHPGTKGTQWFNAGVDGGDPMMSRWHDSLQEATAVAS
jgi:hypothetical protein